MKKIIIVTAFFAAFSCATFAQNNQAAKNETDTKHPIYLVKFNTDNGEPKPFYNFMKAISSKDISLMHVWRGQEAIDHYGEKAQNGAIVVSLMHTENLLTGEQLFEKYNISKKDRVLPVHVDNIIIANNAELYFSADRIASVNIVSEKNKRYISVKTILIEKDDRSDMFKKGKFSLKG